MTAVPDDILKAFEVATKAFVDAVSSDIQVLEDNLKYSGWTSALSIASLLMIAANFHELTANTAAGSLERMAVLLPVIGFVGCLALGGIYHYQVIQELGDKRVQITLMLKQHSIALSSDVSFEDHPPLYEQIWTQRFLSVDDREDFERRGKKPGTQTWIIYVQAALMAMGMLLLFSILFLRA